MKYFSVAVRMCGLGVLLLATSAFHVHEPSIRYELDSSHTSVVWSVSHFGFSSPSGKFTDVEGTLMLNEQHPENSTLDVRIGTKSVLSGVEKLDEHLRSKDFFNSEAFPQARFVSEKVTLSGQNTAKVSGKLTLRGATKPLVLDVVMNKSGEHPMTHKKIVGFSATAQIKRSDFGMTYALPGVSDEVKLAIESEAVMYEAAK